MVSIKLLIHIDTSGNINWWPRSVVVLPVRTVLHKLCVRILLSALFFTCNFLVCRRVPSLWETALTHSDTPLTQSHLALSRSNLFIQQLAVASW